jgi:hypothetical protein
MCKIIFDPVHHHFIVDTIGTTDNFFGQLSIFHRYLNQAVIYLFDQLDSLNFIFIPFLSEKWDRKHPEHPVILSKFFR